MLFVSYSCHDTHMVDEIAGDLHKYGLLCWRDSDCLDLSKPLKPQLYVAVQSAEAIIFVDTRHSRRSPWVRYELTVAGNMLRPIYSVDHRVLHNGRLENILMEPLSV